MKWAGIRCRRRPANDRRLFQTPLHGDDYTWNQLSVSRVFEFKTQFLFCFLFFLFIKFSIFVILLVILSPIYPNQMLYPSPKVSMSGASAQRVGWCCFHLPASFIMASVLSCVLYFCLLLKNTAFNKPSWLINAWLEKPRGDHGVYGVRKWLEREKSSVYQTVREDLRNSLFIMGE